MKRALRILLALFMITAGVAHFVVPGPFVLIVPKVLPSPLFIVQLSGVFEVLGGAGLLVPKTRKLAAWGLVALFVAVFPANINQAVNHISFDPAHPLSQTGLWLRLPFQIVLVAWAWWMTRSDRAEGIARPAQS